MFVHDPITGQPRIVAPTRAKRLGPRPEGCPFCLGNEESTPPEVDRLPADDGTWQVRVVPNLFPLADAHEVLIMSSRHVTSVRQLDAVEWEAALAMWFRRIAHHNAQNAGDACYVHLFVNDGRGAGASLEHSHAQLVVLPRTRGSDELSSRALPGDDCAVCAAARADDDLVVWHGEQVVVRAGEAPRTGGGLLLMPRDHLVALDEVDLRELAQGMQAACAALPDSDFNCWVVQRPAVGAHWYLEFVPRGSTPAGVELALGVGVSIVDPAAAAAQGRERVAAALTSG